MEDEDRRNCELAHEQALKEEEEQKKELCQQLGATQAAIKSLKEEVTSQNRATETAAANMEHIRQQVTVAKQQQEAEASAHQEAEVRAKKFERRASLLQGFLGLILAAVVIAGLEAFIHLNDGKFSVWIRGHNHSMGLQLSFALALLMAFTGLFVRQYWKWLWGTGLVAVVAVILQII